MVHLGATPGTPLHDAARGVEGIIADARADLQALQAAGFDAVMFGNEHDRPYELQVDVAATATMAYVIGRLRDEITVPFGVNVLWDPTLHDGARGRHRARASCARSSPARTPRTWAPGTPTPALPCATPVGSAPRDVVTLYNVSAEFADSLDRRSLPDRARSAVVSVHPGRGARLGRHHRRGRPP